MCEQHIGERKMTLNKTTVAVIMMIALMASSVLALTVRAQPGTTVKTYAVVDAIPNPVGVGEQVLVKTGVLMQLEA